MHIMMTCVISFYSFDVNISCEHFQEKRSSKPISFVVIVIELNFIISDHENASVLWNSNLTTNRKDSIVCSNHVEIWTFFPSLSLHLFHFSDNFCLQIKDRRRKVFGSFIFFLSVRQRENNEKLLIDKILMRSTQNISKKCTKLKKEWKNLIWMHNNEKLRKFLFSSRKRCKSSSFLSWQFSHGNMNSFGSNSFDSIDFLAFADRVHFFSSNRKIIYRFEFACRSLARISGPRWAISEWEYFTISFFFLVKHFIKKFAL